MSWLKALGMTGVGAGAFVPGERLCWRAETAEALGLLLAQLHGVGVPAGTPSSWYHPLSHVVDEVTARLAPYPELQAVLPNARLVTPCPVTVIHGDLWHGNIIEGADGALTLIDWEYAGLGHAILDLADAAVDCGSSDWIGALLAGYEASRPLRPAEQAALAPAMSLTIAIRVARKLAARRQDSIPRELARFAFAQSLSI